MPAIFKANERCYNRTLGLYGLETLNHRSEVKLLRDTQGVKLRLIQAPMRLNFSLWRPNPEN